MKKNSIYALMGAIALAGSVGFSSCSSSSDDVVINNPDYDPETNTVRTQFALNIVPSANRTRMSDATVQNTGFRGMKGVNLISFTGAPATATLATNGFFELGDIAGITADASSKVYTKEIPVGTKNFLFYGKASKTGSDMAEGKLDYHVGTITGVATPVTDPANIYFSLSPIVTEADLTDATNHDKPEDLWLAYLNGISSATGWRTSTGALHKAYETFTVFNAGTRQGSAKAILRTVQDLFKTIATIYEGGTLIEADNTIAKAVMDKINTSPIAVTKESTANDIYTSGAIVAFADATADISKFPTNLSVPSGTAALSCTSGSFSYLNTGTNVLGQGLTTAITSICYPAELTYFCNSPLRATDASMKTTDYQSTVANWNDASKWPTTTWTDTEVKLSTRAVAMTYNVRYGVALLKSTFKVEAGNYYDNAKAITNNEKDNQQIAISGTTFAITGIIISGQPSKSDYQFLKHTTDGAFTQNVYDYFSTSGTNLGSDPVNYTLLMDNYDASATTKQADVNVALELVNNGTDFYGRDGIIGAGQTFYLVGTLTAPTSLTDVWTAEQAGPGYPVTLIKRIFAQDFLTDATFTLKKGKNATDATAGSFLKDAYSVVPDLRSTQMTFGLSVDLVWKTGLTFTVDL